MRQVVPERATSVMPLTSTALIEVEDLAGWPTPSARPTTPVSAMAFELATTADSMPSLPEIQIDDGFGI
jgi:hypothetical protein